MGFVKDMYAMDDYNDDYFYFMQEKYEDIDDIMGGEIAVEYEATEILHTMNLLREISNSTGIACDTAVAALNDFLDKYEEYYEIP